MRSGWSNTFPKLYEIYKDSKKSGSNYFICIDFEKTIKREDRKKYYIRLEKDLASLDENAWHEFKKKC